MGDDIFLYDCWHVAGWAHEVPASAPFSRRLLDRPVVLWRDSNGQCIAMEDVCPHRFAPLSMGRLQNGLLRCMYHGLQFDPSGKCVHIPGQAQVSETLAVNKYPLVERDHLLWIWLGDPSKADPMQIPDCHWLDDPAWTYTPGYVHFDADYRLLIDNLLDFSHLSFVHEKTLGGTPTAAMTPPEIQRFDWGVHISHWHPNEPVPPAYQKVVKFQGNCDRWMNYNWFVEGNMLNMETGFAPAGTGAKDGERAPGTIVHHPIQAVTPETANSTHYFWSQARNYALDDREISALLSKNISAAFDEDKRMIEAQANNMPNAKGRTMMVIRADIAVNHVRRLMSKRAGGWRPQQTADHVAS